MAQTPISTFTGGCLCGKVRWRAEGEPFHVNHCHCEMCRRASGAPIVTWATFPSSKVGFDGPRVVRRSSQIASRSFCGECGSPLTWQGDASPAEIDLTAGTFDDPSSLMPRDHLWTDSRVAWLTISDDLPRYRTSRKGGLTEK